MVMLSDIAETQCQTSAAPRSAAPLTGAVAKRAGFGRYADIAGAVGLIHWLRQLGLLGGQVERRGKSGEALEHQYRMAMVGG
jgi:hypothetical protein